MFQVVFSEGMTVFSDKFKIVHEVCAGSNLLV